MCCVVGQDIFGHRQHGPNFQIGVVQRHHDRGEAAHHLDGARVGQPSLEHPAQRPTGRRVGHADQEGAVTEGPHLPVWYGACHARAGATTSIPAPAMA